MNHKKGFNKLNRNASHRKALLRNMATVLFKHERIVTTKAKAIEVRRVAEKMITRAKEDSVHNRRVVGEKIADQAVLAKLFTDIGPRMKERNGGYTRILKIGFRDQDVASMVVLELVDHKLADDKKADKKKAAEKPKKAEPKAASKAKKTDSKPDTKSKAKAPRATKKAAEPAEAKPAAPKSAE
ncbi:MAG: 50S ribosomal protein L17 [Spirochaetes bacterium]|nr:50S ribosomal protein L17 [Spirochaetota bacterium]MBU1080492.1 50S ribosomal protein L17 [Spirochaetota bacterium]